MPPGKLPMSDLRRYLLRDADHPSIATAVRFATFGIVLAIGLWILYVASVTAVYPYPLEYREGAPQLLTQMLLDGKNPFSLQNQPLGLNQYGIVGNLIVLPFAAVFGNTLLVQRLVADVFVFLCFPLAFWTVYAAHRDATLATACGGFVIMSVAARDLGGLPNAMGVFLFLAAILIPFNRGFDRRGLVLSALVCLLAFYTKPYFVLAFGVVASYTFIFVSRKRAGAYGVLFAALFGIAFALVRLTLPLYFVDVLVSNLSTEPNESAFLYKQLMALAIQFYPAIFSALVMITSGALQRPLGVTDVAGSFHRVDPWAVDQGRPSRSSHFLAFFFLCCMLAFVLILGPHTGTYLSYSYQLVLPAFFLWLFYRLRLQSGLGLILQPVLLINLILFCQGALWPAMLRDMQDKSRAWSRLYEYVDHSRHILNSPLIVPEMIRLGMWPIDSGHSGYYYAIRPHIYPDNGLLGPPYADVKDNGQRYLDSIRAAVANREFDAIILDQRLDFFYDRVLISRYYQLTKTIFVVIPGQAFNVDIWVPTEPADENPPLP